MLGSVLTMSMFSCNTSELADAEVSPTAEQLKSITYQGLPVNIRADFPQKALAPASFAEYTNYLKSVSSPNARTGGTDISKMSGQYLLELMMEAKKNYPDLSKSPMAEKDLRQIRRSFPTIRTEEDVWKNHNVIFDFYNDLIREEALQKALKSPKVSTPNGRFSLGEGLAALGSIPAYTLWVGWPFAWIKLAADDADRQILSDINTEVISNSPQKIDHIRFCDGQRGNAYRHAFWNALSIYYMINAGVSKDRAIDKMRDVATTYEAGYKKESDIFWSANDFFWNDPQSAFDRVDIQSVNVAMDLHKNMVGRTYMEQNTSWGVWIARRMPSYDEIRAEMRSRAIGATETITNDAKVIHRIYDGGNPDHGFEILKWWNYDNHYRPLIYIKN